MNSVLAGSSLRRNALWNGLSPRIRRRRLPRPLSSRPKSHGPRLRRYAERLTEHLHEGARLPVADCKRNFLHTAPTGEKLDRLDQSKLPPPRFEIQPNVALEGSFDGAHARARIFAEGSERRRVRGVCDGGFGDGKRARVAGKRHASGNR